jgi:hypothetical protein
MAGLSREPMTVSATLLPPAKLLYGAGETVEPKLQGTWNIGRNTMFAASPPNAVNGIVVSIIVITKLFF